MDFCKDFLRVLSLLCSSADAVVFHPPPSAADSMVVDPRQGVTETHADSVKADSLRESARKIRERFMKDK